ncbi:serine proteinase stubble-like isoform X2 [Stegodyphus dumicola]|nr:serine proteinase stubble-like isoform X2 [Stegodyphus dumicola]
MFVWECIKTEGKHLGTCADGFLFGSCCAHNDSKNDLIPVPDSTVTDFAHKKPTSSSTTSQSPIYDTKESVTISSEKLTAHPESSSYTEVKPNHIQPTVPSSPHPVKPEPTSRPTYAKPVPPSRPTYVKPVFTSVPTSVKPGPLSRPTTVKPLVSSRPASIKPVTPTRPTSIKPVLSTRPTSVQPVFPSRTTSVKPVPPTRPTSVKPALPSRPTYVKPASPSRPIYVKPGSSSKPIYFKPPSRPTYFKPKPPSRPSFVKPVSHTSLHANSTVPVTSNSKPSPVSRPSQTTSSQRPIEVSTTRTPFPISTTANQGYSFVAPTTDSKGWFRPSGIPSVLVTITNFPAKFSSTRRPQTTQRTTKYPFTQASWKPRPPTTKKPSEKPQIFTFTNYHQTQPSYVVSVLTTQSSNFHVPNTTTVKSTLPNSSELYVDTSTKPSISNSFSSTSQKPTTVYPLSTTSKFTTEPKLPLSTIFKPNIQFNHTSSTQYFWFTPESHKNTTTKAPPPSGLVTQWLNSSFTEGSSLDQEISFRPPVRPVPSFKPTKEPVEIITLKPWNPFFEFSSEQLTTAASSKTTTPLPITPCGIQNPHPQKKVVGGKNSAFGSWPWQASVRRTSFFGFSSTHRCGGALISRQWVATAGHCVDDLLLSQIKIRVGEYDFASVQEPHGYVERGAKKKVVHPRYNFFTYENDLALVQLEEAIDSQKYPHISPICLPPSEESLVGKNATVTGWGRLSEGGVLPSILQEVQVPIISNEKCKNMFLAAGRHEYIPDIFMCAGFEEGGRDSCQGDSGGPLQIQSDEGYWFLAGIISWGIGCAEPNMPGVCTRISKFKDWVVQHIT